MDGEVRNPGGAVDKAVLSRMRRDWDERARENALHYVANARDAWDDDDFLESGRESVRAILLEDSARLFPDRDPATLRVLEIGCGAGRMTRALAETVREVHAVDVSGEMVSRAQDRLQGFDNARVCQNDGAGLDVLEVSDFDLAISYIVFQHIPEAEVLESYLRDVATRLKPQGVFKMQVQGDPLAVLGRGDTWEGCFVAAAVWLIWARRYGFRLIDFEREGAQYLWLWWQRAESPNSGLSDLELAFVNSERMAFEECLQSMASQTRKAIDDRIAVEEALEEMTSRFQRAMDEQSRLSDGLFAVYCSPAYRVGRRLGLAPMRIGPGPEAPDET